MKTRNSNGFNRKTKVCVMIGFYDNEGEYCERLKEDIELRELPEKVIERVNFRYDITTLYSNAHVLVIAKTKQKIEDYKTQMARPKFFHSLLNNGDCRYYDEYKCIVTNLKTTRQKGKKFVFTSELAS